MVPPVAADDESRQHLVFEGINLSKVYFVSLSHKIISKLNKFSFSSILVMKVQMLRVKIY